MENNGSISNRTRREFLKSVTAAGSVILLGTGDLFDLSKTISFIPM